MLEDSPEINEDSTPEGVDDTDDLMAEDRPMPNSREALREEYERLRQRIRRLERQLADSEFNAPPTSRPALEKTLQHLLQKVTMILRAEKCCVMVYNSETNELEAQTPAIGMTDDQVRVFRVRASEGISGHVFRTREPEIFDDAATDERTVKENVTVLGVHCGATVPLIHERREGDVVVDTQSIGVLHVFNKRRGKTFTKEDVRILKLMSRSAAAVIAEAKLFIEIRERADTLERTYESLPAGIILVNPEGAVRLMNREARQLMLKEKLGDPIGRSYQDILASDKLVGIIGNTMVDQKELEDEITPEASDRVFRAQTAIVWDNGAFSGVVAIFSDVTDLRNLERMKAAFVTTVSHELRTPLTSIQGFTRTLLADVEDTYPADARREFLTIIDNECKKLNRLVDDLQKVARIDEGHGLDLTITRVHVGELLERLVDAHQSYSIGHVIKLELAAGAREAPLLSDGDRIDQIVANLLSNAIKYSPVGSEVIVSGSTDGAAVRISVQDFGRGIPHDELGRVFDRFYRGVDEPKDAGGAGLGLYIVKHLVDRIGATIEADSSIGIGSTFTVTIPLSPNDETSGVG